MTSALRRSALLLLLAALPLTTPARAAAPPRSDPGKLVAYTASQRPQTEALAVGDTVRTGPGERRRWRLPDGSALYANEQTSGRLVGDQRFELAAGAVFVELTPRAARPFVVQAPGRSVRGKAGSFAVEASRGGAVLTALSGEARVDGVSSAVRGGQVLEPDSERPGSARERIPLLLGWVRDLLPDSQLVPASAHAGGSLTARTPEGQEAKLALRKYHVDVHIEDGFARTTIDQTFFNSSHERLEGTFRFPLPADASLSRLAMYVDGTLMEGGMAERDYARNVYERIVNQQRDPALLEWVDGSTFKMRVFPLEPRQEKRILLSYSQRLPSLYGRLSYRFPAGHSLRQVGAFSAHVRVKGGKDLAWDSTSHPFSASRDGDDLLLNTRKTRASLERDVVLNLSDPTGAKADAEDVRFSSHQQDGHTYLMVRHRPQLPALPLEERRDWVFLVETSADRDRLLARTQIEIVRSLLHRAGPDDTFAVLTCSTQPQTFTESTQPVTPENVERAVAFLENAHLIGALDLGKGLDGAATLLKRTKNPWLVHVGSATPALGTRANEELVKKLPGGTRYVGVGVGKRWNRSLMKLAAEKTSGHFTQINPDENLSYRALELSCALNAARLLDVSVKDSSGRWRFLPFVQSVTQGEEVAAVARAEAGTPLPEIIEVRGILAGRAFEKRLKVEKVGEKASYLPRTWASLEIERLLAEDASKNKPGIIELSKAMYVMTPFTSLLVLENEDMYRQFKVDRGRKDHWALYPAPARIAVVKEGGTGKPSRETVLRSVALRRTNFAEALEAQSKFKPGDPFDQRKVDADVARIRGWMGYQGKDGLVSPYTDILRSVQEANTGSLLFGVGVNSDSGLTGSIIPARVGEILIVGNERNARSVMAGAPIIKVYNVPGGNSAALARTLQEAYKSSSTLISSAGNKLLVYGAPEDHSEIQGQIVASGDLTIAERNLSRLGIFDSDKSTPQESSIEQLATVSEDLQQIGSERPPNAFRNLSRPALTPLERWIEQRSNEDLREVRRAALYARQGRYEGYGASGNGRFFADLLAHAPGLHASRADLEAILDAEAAPSSADRPGKIDPAARALLARARTAGWRSLQRDGFTITFDGQGRYAWARTLPGGLREQVACDATTLWHLYPELGLAARRKVSAFHRLAFQRLVPLCLPQAEDLARGADLTLAAPRTLAVVPHGERNLQIEMAFDADGLLQECRLVADGKVRLRQVFSPEGSVKWLDEDGKTLHEQEGVLRTASALRLKPDTADMVVLDLPVRTVAHLRATTRVVDRPANELTIAEATALLAAHALAGDQAAAHNVFRAALHARDQRQIGYYVLLAAAGVQLEGGDVDVQAEHPDSPLAQYLALFSSPTLRKNASAWAANANVWPEGLLKRLALGHALCQRWQPGGPLRAKLALRKAERDRALAYARKYPRTDLAWDLLELVQGRLGEAERSNGLTPEVRTAYRELATAWEGFTEVPAVTQAAIYERARCLWKAREGKQARALLRGLHEKALASGNLLRLDPDFRSALLDAARGEEGWRDLLDGAADALKKKGRREGVLALAWQCWQLGDEVMAERLLPRALEGTEGREATALRLETVALLLRAKQPRAAEEHLQELLRDPGLAGRPGLWRLASRLAQEQRNPARELECLERALELEYRQALPLVRRDEVEAGYSKLLASYARQGEALQTLKLPVPAALKDRVVRAADRWRELDPQGEGQACDRAASILASLGESELAWDYQTTPVARHPGEARPLIELAEGLARRGERALADRAYESAFAAEPTNAQILWDRARNAAGAGQVARARALYRRLAEGEWQPRFDGLKQQARAMLDGR